MRFCVVGGMDEWFLSARETVDADTPAFTATSPIFTRRLREEFALFIQDYLSFDEALRNYVHKNAFETNLRLE